MSTIRLLITRLRRDQLPLTLIVLLIFVSALIAAAAPRLFNRTTDAGLRYQVASATVLERNLQLGRITTLNSAGNDGMHVVDAAAVGVEGGLPDSLRALTDSSSVVAKTVPYSVLDRPVTRPGFVTLAFQDRLDDQIRLIEGTLPSGRVEWVPAPDLPPASVPIPPDLQALEFEVAISDVTAEQLEIGVGDRMEMVPDTNDPLVGAFGFLAPAAVRVVGTFEVIDPAADFWVGDRTLAEPNRVPIGINTVQIRATVLASPAAYPRAAELGFPMRYSFRHTIDPERLDAGMLDQLVTDLNQMEAVYPRFATTPDPTRTTLQTGLLELTQRFRAELRSSQAVLTTAAIGPGAVALAALAVLALMAVRRRRGGLLLIRGRGGSAVQLIGSHLVEGLLLSVGPAAAALLLVSSLIEGRPSPMSALAAGVVALLAAAVIVGVSVPLALGSMRRLERDAPADIGASPRRLVFEGLAVGLAVGGVVLLRQRGLAGGSSVGELAGVDPFLAAVPVLIGLAVGIVTVRVYPYPVRAAGWMAAVGRGLAPALGLRRAERQSGTGLLPMLVLLLTVAIGTFSSTMLATIDRGQSTESWRTVGAAFRVDSSNLLPSDLDLQAVTGVESVAGFREVDATVGIGGNTGVTLMVLDAPEYEAVVAGTPAEAGFPSAFSTPVDPYCVGELDTPPSEPPACPGTEDAPVPAFVSQAMVDASRFPIKVGDTFQLSVIGRFATFQVAGIREAMPGQRPGRVMVLAPRDLLRAQMSDRIQGNNGFFVRAPESSAAGLRELVDESRVVADVTSREELLSSLRERPLVEAVGAGFTVAVATAVGYAALAVIVALVLAGLARAREAAQLRTLGVSRGQLVLLTVIEQAPPIVVAIVAGLALGLGIAWVVMPGLQLGAFTGAGASVDPALTIDFGQLLGVTAAMLAFVVIGIGLASLAQRGTDPAKAIRSAVE